jgi:hypothetical protein
MENLENMVNSMSLADLYSAQKILESKLIKENEHMNAMWGRDYQEYKKRETEYHSSPYYQKLVKVQERIEFILDRI